VHKSRPAGSGRKAVAADDHSIFAARFENGAIGSFTASWVTPGRKMQLDFEIVGTTGSLVFSQERFNELQLYTDGEAKARSGFRTILAGPDTPPYGDFCPAPGHQLGFNDLKTIEVAHLVRAIAGEENAAPDFGEAYEIQRVITAALESSGEKRWINISECR
jgi:predicted dehydrogenase